MKHQPLPGWLAYSIASTLPKSQRSVVVKRVGTELHDLFLKRYKEQFGEGLQLKISKRDGKFSYRPASAALSLQEISVPNPTGIMSQFNVLSALWNDCIANLKRLSSVVAHSTEAGMSVKAWNALPAELQKTTDHPLTEQFVQFIEQHTGDSAQTIVPAKLLASLTGHSESAKLTVAACRKMAEMIEKVGYSVEPDARLIGRSYQPDQPLVLFLNLSDTAIDPGRYLAASTLLNVGMALARSDGAVDEATDGVLRQHLDAAFDLNETERRRLGMLRAIFDRHPVELSEVIKPLKKLPDAQRQQIAKFALALVVRV